MESKCTEIRRENGNYHRERKGSIRGHRGVKDKEHKTLQLVDDAEDSPLIQRTDIWCEPKHQIHHRFEERPYKGRGHDGNRRRPRSAVVETGGLAPNGQGKLCQFELNPSTFSRNSNQKLDVLLDALI